MSELAPAARFVDVTSQTSARSRIGCRETQIRDASVLFLGISTVVLAKTVIEGQIAPNSPSVLNEYTSLLFRLTIFDRVGQSKAGHAAHQPIRKLKAFVRVACKPARSGQRGLGGNPIAGRSSGKGAPETVVSCSIRENGEHSCVDSELGAHLDSVVTVNPRNVSRSRRVTIHRVARSGGAQIFQPAQYGIIRATGTVAADSTVDAIAGNDVLLVVEPTNPMSYAAL